ncbi:site-specific integrase [Peribacillus castrilensis]|uniref:tyrosine-type recombinase/integrase n=1 Tax=Peribacillus TaxID=2675229 RepID=UPI0038714F1D
MDIEIERKTGKAKMPNILITIDNISLILPFHPQYKLGHSTRLEDVKVLIRNIHHALVNSDLSAFRKMVKKHKAFPIKISLHFWKDYFLQILYIAMELNYPKRLPAMRTTKFFTDLFNINNKTIISDKTMSDEVFETILKFCFDRLKIAAEEVNAPEFKRLLKHLAVRQTRKNLYSKALNQLDHAIKDLLKTLALENVENHIDPTPNLLYKSLFGKGAKNRDTLIRICEEISFEVKPLYIKHMRNLKPDFPKDIWTFYKENETGQFKQYTLDFSVIYEPLRSSFKKYFKQLATEEGLELGTLDNYLDSCKTFICLMQDRANDKNNPKSSVVYHTLISNILTIKYAPDLLSIKSELEELYKLSTVKKVFGAMRGFFTWYSDEMKYEGENPFHKVTIRNLDDHTKHTEEIPQEVFNLINDNLSSFKPMIQNAWIILTNSGIRISELLDLKFDSLNFNKINQQYQLTYIPNKQEKDRRIKQEDKFHHIYATPALITAFNNQLKITAELRKKNNLKSLFIHNRNGPRILYGGTMVNSLNNFLKKNGVDFKISNHMCRKNLIVSLLTEGHSVEEIANITAQTPKTILRSYFGIQEKKLAEMEDAYFEEAFEHLFKPKFNEKVSKEDLEAIRLEIKRGARKAPNGNGYCGKNISFGPCVKSRCIGCRLLVTTPQQIPLYRTLLKEQENHISNLESQFENLRIPKEEYTTYRDYQSDLDYLKLIQDGLNKLIDFVKEKVPENEQSQFLD